MYHAFLLLALATTGQPVGVAESVEAFPTQQACDQTLQKYLPAMTARFEEQGLVVLDAKCAVETVKSPVEKRDADSH